jgi:hypothetical protein
MIATESFNGVLRAADTSDEEDVARFARLGPQRYGKMLLATVCLPDAESANRANESRASG